MWTSEPLQKAVIPQSPTVLTISVWLIDQCIPTRLDRELLRFGKC